MYDSNCKHCLLNNSIFSSWMWPFENNSIVWWFSFIRDFDLNSFFNFISVDSNVYIVFARFYFSPSFIRYLQINQEVSLNMEQFSLSNSFANPNWIIQLYDQILRNSDKKSEVIQPGNIKKVLSIELVLLNRIIVRRKKVIIEMNPAWQA